MIEYELTDDLQEIISCWYEPIECVLGDSLTPLDSEEALRWIIPF